MTRGGDRRKRCSSCGRVSVSSTVVMLAPLERHVDLILRAAREFDDQTPEGEHYTALDFADWLATGARAEGMMNTPAGHPAARQDAA